MSNSYLTGSSWSEDYARRSVPILVSLAEKRSTITYKELAELLGDEKYAHPLMSALGTLGKALNSLSKREGKKLGNIPPIQLLVCNSKTGRPGDLALSFLGFRPAQTARMSEQQLDTLVGAAHERIFSFQHWQGVLKLLGLKPLTLSLPSTATLIPKIEKIEQRSSGEGEEHRRLKRFLARNPRRIGIRWNGPGDMERAVLSGDRLDISFRNDEVWICIEVKGKHSPVPDLIRGIFQCVKYRAVLAAHLRYEALQGVQFQRTVVPRVLLACGARLPRELQDLADSMEVEVKAGITVPADFVQ